MRSGTTATLTLYGENLAPTAVTVNKPSLTVLLGVKPTEGDEKKRGSQQVSIELAVPAGSAPDLYELTLVHEGDVKVSAPVVVAEEAGTEAEVRRPNATFAQAMPLPGPAATITGALANDTPDVFRFDAKAGETWTIALLAGRAGIGAGCSGARSGPAVFFARAVRRRRETGSANYLFAPQRTAPITSKYGMRKRAAAPNICTA